MSIWQATSEETRVRNGTWPRVKVGGGRGGRIGSRDETFRLSG